MKITINENVELETEKTFCDICFNEIPTRSFYICSICNRDICYSCFGEPKEIEGLPVMPCPLCRKITKYINPILNHFNLADGHRDKAFRLQEKWGKDSRNNVA